MGSYFLMGAEFQLGKMKNLWRWMVGMVVQNLSVLHATESYTENYH